MYKYILLWCYHDYNYIIFTDYNALIAYIKKLKLTYYHDKDFSYKVYKGRELKDV